METTKITREQLNVLIDELRKGADMWFPQNLSLKLEFVITLAVKGWQVNEAAVQPVQH